MKAKLTYFKRTGKYYADGELFFFETQEQPWELATRVRKLRREGRLPGLKFSNEPKEFVILLETPDSYYGVPMLLQLDDDEINGLDREENDGPRDLATLRALLENAGEDPGGEVMMGLADLEACDDEYGIDRTFGALLRRVWEMAREESHPA